ncbi:MAG: ADP-ribosylation factor-like protein, partial [Candidatus Heimdallarchaeota archaeon]
FDNVVSSQVHDDVTILVLLNKADLPDGMDRSKFIEEFGLPNLPYNWSCAETSAKTGDGIYDSFKWFVDELREALNIG